MKTEDLKNYIFEQLNETSFKRAYEYSKARSKQGNEFSKASDLIYGQLNKRRLQNASPEELSTLDKTFHTIADLSINTNKKARTGFVRSGEALRREQGLPPTPRTPKQESAFNFINGLKRLQEAKKFPPITIEELKSPDANKHHARRGVKHSDPKVAIEALKLAFRLNDAKTAWMGKDHPDQEVRDTAEMSRNMDEN